MTGRLLSDKELGEMKRLSLNVAINEDGELTSTRSFVIESVIGHYVGSVDGFVYVRDTDGIVWELPLHEDSLAVVGRRLRLTTTRRITVSEMRCKFES